MCLTEPHCGSDVGLLNTRAEPHADGSYRISGTKIFISSGNTILPKTSPPGPARLPDPPGDQGNFVICGAKKIGGRTKPVVCGAIEDKMGIHGNATACCTLKRVAATW
ncbi:MAG: hypothetical protein Ct9H300mP8_03670 [Gammaproteobacteria bacterium]|nr:MAG: hypothetical protein Ct9H300mP8_03670 [Gammaproteobacteria bacterium]